MAQPPFGLWPLIFVAGAALYWLWRSSAGLGFVPHRPGIWRGILRAFAALDCRTFSGAPGNRWLDGAASPNPDFFWDGCIPSGRVLAGRPSHTARRSALTHPGPLLDRDRGCPQYDPDRVSLGPARLCLDRHARGANGLADWALRIDVNDIGAGPHPWRTSPFSGRTRFAGYRRWGLGLGQRRDQQRRRNQRPSHPHRPTEHQSGHQMGCSADPPPF